MKWSFVRERDGTLAGGTLKVDEVLYEFDEPLIFRATVGPLDCLLNKLSSRNGGSYYLAVEADDETVLALKSGMLSVRGAFLSDAYWIFFQERVSGEMAYWRLGRSEVPEKFLPKSQRPLYYWQEPAPDSMAQANSIFSIKFTGRQLNDSSISLGRLKSLVDKSFTTIRTLLTPIALQNSRSSTLDFDCQIAISSFVVSVKSPIVNMQAVRRRRENSDLTLKGIENGIRYQGHILGEKIKEMAEVTRNPNGIEKYASDNLLLTIALADLMPSEDGFFDAVEFSAAGEGSINTITFRLDDAIALRAALDEVEKAPVLERGKIVGGSEKSRTIRIMSFRGRQVTCKFTPDQFELVAPDGKLDLSRYLSLRGVLQRRDRVDYMDVETFEFINPRSVV